MRTFELLGRPAVLGVDDVICHDEDVGPDYSLPPPQMAQAVRLLARAAGILLDPVYSGKVMAGLIDLIRQGRWSRRQTVLFIHTGGVLAVYHLFWRTFEGRRVMDQEKSLATSAREDMILLYVQGSAVWTFAAVGLSCTYQ